MRPRHKAAENDGTGDANLGTFSGFNEAAT